MSSINSLKDEFASDISLIGRTLFTEDSKEECVGCIGSYLET